MLPSTTWCTRSVTFRAFFPGQYMIYGFRIMSEDVVSAVISAFVTEGGYYETRLMPVNPSDTEFDIMNSHRLTRYHTIHPPVKASGLNLGVMRYKLKRNFWLCMKIAVHGHPIVKHLEPVVQDIPECKKYVISQLGMSSGKINNDSIKASSSANSSSPYFARLNHPDGWSPSTADSAPWLQIMLPKMAVVYGFVAAVRSTFHADPSFHVKYAENEDEELKYAMDPYFNDIAIFPMRSSVVNTVETEEDLPVPLRATIVRIILLKHARFNFELYGIYPDSQSS
ncbi:uncharacterized protein [Diadema setosum]|uniref:uncharacterized protein n=1 Tax=Diadema setosum TaxID=31175 RepID=UPI003B3B5E88